MSKQWFSVRCVFRWKADRLFEVRITIWYCKTFEKAVRRAEEEAIAYARANKLKFVGLSQAYLVDGEMCEGAEVFSLLRESRLSPDKDIDRFFDTGKERQGHMT